MQSYIGRRQETYTGKMAVLRTFDLSVEELPALSLRLFGQAEAFCGGISTQLPSRRAGWLLAILALREGQPIERQSLAGLVWPDSSDDGALHNLRQTLAGLRRALGPAAELLTAVSPRSICMEMSDRIWVDALRFDKLAEATDPEAMERATDLYRGPLLEGCDEPFAIEHRGTRERAFLGLVERLAAHHSSHRDHSRAVALLRRAVATDPYHESAVRGLMTSLADSGEAPAALEAYRNFRSRLDQDLNTEPDPETKSLYRAIRKGTATQVRSSRAHSPADRHLPSYLTSLLGRELALPKSVPFSIGAAWSP
jgi:DNA-binding SARP family transcriptional activator